jgi:pentatricopeptide repeat protein
MHRNYGVFTDRASEGAISRGPATRDDHLSMLLLPSLTAALLAIAAPPGVRVPLHALPSRARVLAPPRCEGGMPPLDDVQTSQGKAPSPSSNQRDAMAVQMAMARARSKLEALEANGLNSVSCADTLSALAEAGDPEGCLSLLRHMRRANVQPTLECYGFVVSALQAAGRTREATKWLGRVVQPEVSEALLNRAVKEGEVVTRERYNRVLASYAAAGRPSEAVTTMKQMVHVGGVTPDII